jgi:hypothetical protein
MVRYRYTDEDVALAVEQSESVAGVMRLLGIKPAGGSHFHISKRIKKLGLDTSHFTGQGHNKGKTFHAHRKSADEILVERHDLGRRAKPHLLRRALLEVGIPHMCAECGTHDTWNGRPLTLYVDHINGDSLDCRLENLQFLCPNCHSQTPNFCRKMAARHEGSTAA